MPSFPHDDPSTRIKQKPNSKSNKTNLPLLWFTHDIDAQKLSTLMASFQVNLNDPVNLWTWGVRGAKFWCAWYPRRIVPFSAWLLHPVTNFRRKGHQSLYVDSQTPVPNKAVTDHRLHPSGVTRSYLKHIMSFSCRYICWDIMCKHDVINIQHYMRLHILYIHPILTRSSSEDCNTVTQCDAWCNKFY